MNSDKIKDFAHHIVDKLANGWFYSNIAFDAEFEKWLKEQPQKQLSNEEVQALAEKANAYEFIKTKDGKRNAFNEGFLTGYNAAQNKH